MGTLILALLASTGWAAPVYWEPGRRTDELVVELAPGATWEVLAPLAPGATARPVHRRLPRFVRVKVKDAEVVATLLRADSRVHDAWLAYAPMPPPADIPPTTDDFRPLQTWLDTLGFTEAARWPGGLGENVTIADIEYGWDPDHEDLEATIGARAWGLDTEQYRFHGTSVLGQLFAGDNGYGVVGAAVGARPLVVSPFDEEGTYDVAAAIAGATDLLAPGDVILIEQQAWDNGDYCPISADPAVFAAIEDAVAAGIVVVEPGGNGAADLDDDSWDGWFDRRHDSGSILVGGGASPESGFDARSWYPSGSSYGERVDVQGWYDSIVTTTGGDYEGWYADLYYPGEDEHQAYTASFGGTSGASPMIAAMAAVAQSVAIELTGEPWEPEALRAALVASGTPQQGERAIGPEPDLRRLLRTWFVP